MIAKVYAIVDLENLDDDESYIRALLGAGTGILQLRGKIISPAALLDFSRQVIELRNLIAPGCRIIINDLIEIAAEAGADGVHLGQNDRPAAEARTLLGPDSLIGLSTHNAEQAANAPVEILNYLAFGPVFPSKTKSGHAPVTGLAALEAVSAGSRLPVVAIGGITAENATDVFAAGASSVAVISELRRAKNLVDTVRALSGA